MNWTNPALYVAGALLTLGPVGLRVVTRASPEPHTLETSMVQEGHKLFVHDWKPRDPLCPNGDGLGPVFNATSCKACHLQGGIGGAGGLEHNVTVFVVQSQTRHGELRQGVVHTGATHEKYQETLWHVSPGLPSESRVNLRRLLPNRPDDGPGAPQVAHHELRRPNDPGAHRLPIPHNVHLSQRNTPALFGAKLIDELPDRVIIALERKQKMQWGMTSSNRDDVPVGRAFRLADGRIGKFGWKAQSATLSDFVQAACANELGLSNAGSVQPTPLGAPKYQAVGLDLTLQQCDQITAFIASLPRPVERMAPTADGQLCVESGRKSFHKIGCAACHTSSVGSIEGIYSDLLMHRMGEELEGSGSYNAPPRITGETPGGPLPDEWRTPPLWGVADSAPYLHDGRAATLDEAIRMHGGQGKRAAERYTRMSDTERSHLMAFLRTLKAPKPQ